MTRESVIGNAEPLTAGVWRIPLPSRTLPPYDHTNSYLVQTGKGGVLIDLGTDDDAALDRLETLLGSLGVSHLHALLLTHTHPDHCAGAAWFQEHFGVPVYAHPLEPAPFPCEPLEEDEAVFGVRAVHTPGHSPGHLSYAVADVLLVGDLLAAQGSTWVGLPGGNVTDYLDSLTRTEGLVRGQKIRMLGPGHGPSILKPLPRLQEVRAHRLARVEQVLRALKKPRTLTTLREAVYPGVTEEALRAADGSLLALLEKLVLEERVAEHTSERGEATWISR